MISDSADTDVAVYLLCVTRKNYNLCVSRGERRSERGREDSLDIDVKNMINYVTREPPVITISLFLM